ncbi:hypothetical protein TUM12370_37320 [Salmonella enterica subsp. enterica serovar Choleraesuis]|nr:hypothetical protein TUM12370_37320 [Salmonella enterica subsp. enterica serovar Choleraesuis]
MIRKGIWLTSLISSPIFSMPMSDFIHQHYQSDKPEIEITQNLTPVITIDKQKISMESQTLDELKQKTKASVMTTSQYQWLCISDAASTGYAFISDNLMGGGYMTSLAILKNAYGCKYFPKEISVQINNISLPDATDSQLTNLFGKISKVHVKNMLVNDGYIQMNSLQYFPADRGIIINQITTN